jgi:hypothetical protein
MMKRNRHGRDMNDEELEQNRFLTLLKYYLSKFQGFKHKGILIFCAISRKSCTDVRKSFKMSGKILQAMQSAGFFRDKSKFQKIIGGWGTFFISFSVFFKLHVSYLFSSLLEN